MADGAESKVGLGLPPGCLETELPGASSSPSPASPLPQEAPLQRLLFSQDLVSGRVRGALRFGLVRLIHGEDSEDDEELHCSSGSEEGPVQPLRRGYVRVQWYPEGNKQAVKESRLKLEDRSVVPRDVVRRMSSNDSQCGIVIDANIDCAVKLVGTNCVLYPVNSKHLHHIWPFMYGDYIAYDCWLGKVYNLKTQIILKLSNGARCSMSSDDGSKLYDVCPHVSDSGLFFDDSYGFYPGQVLIGPSKVFSNVQWLSGVKPVLSTKSKFRVVVEEVQVTELKVTWITKSFCPGGAETLSPPPSVISQEDLSRVKRLDCFDHTQRQLGERYLYVFPAKIEPAKVTCECPEKNCLVGERSVAKKVKRLLKRQIVRIISNSIEGTIAIEHPNGETLAFSAAGDLPIEKKIEKETVTTVKSHSSLAPVEKSISEDPIGGKVEYSSDASDTCLVEHTQSLPILNENSVDCSSNYTSNYRLQVMDQDADDEAADDTDDTSSVTSSASSTASSQSGGTGRKKSIPLSIKNLKRKHKKKKTKISREFKPGDRVAVEVVTTMTTADVMWQDGTVEKNIRSNDLLPVHHMDNNEFCPGDFVVDKRAQLIQDLGVYGVVQSGDHMGRTCVVKWFILKPSGDDVELIREEEDVSVYDIADHPDFRFRTTDIVIRIGNTGDASVPKENEPSVGQVARVDVSSKVEVVWADDSKTIVLPQHLYNVESEIEETDYDSIEGSSSGASSEWEDDSDSWETDYGLTEEDHTKNDDTQPIEATLEDETKTDEAQGATAAPSSSAEKVDGIPKSFRELKEAIKILESLKNMTVEQLLTGSPTSPTVEPEKPTKEKKFLDDIKKLQETLKKTMDNVAIAEEQKMEVALEVEKKEEKVDAQLPVRSEWPSDTPVLCQGSGGKPGVTFTSARGEVFSVLEYAPDNHAFKKMEFQPPEAKKFFNTVRKEMALLATSLPDGIMVKTFEDRMDLFSAVIKGPTRTPYEDCLFLFDIQLPNIYPAVPPLFRYLSQCSGRLNPNLYDNGKVCVSLLGTWIGKGTERWTSKSSLLQVLISIQGLILVNEPYYNEAGFDSDRGLQEGYENSRCYNEMTLIRVVQSMTQLLKRPVEVFSQEIREHFTACGWRLVHRIEAWLETNDLVEKTHDHEDSSTLSACCGLAESPTETAPLGEFVSSPGKLDGDLSITETTSVDSAVDTKELDDSGCGTSTLAPGDVHLCDTHPCDSHSCLDPEGTVQSKTVTLATSPMDEPKVDLECAVQPNVKPKKRRKSYRSFLPEKSGYPDIGFPLFPLSKGFMKSIRGVLLNYKTVLLEANIPDPEADK